MIDTDTDAETQVAQTQAALSQIRDDPVTAVAVGTVVCGIDLGGKRARLCFLDPDNVRKPLMVRFEPEKKDYRKLDYIEACRWACASVPNVWATLRPLVVWVEEPRGQSQRTVHQLSVMAGALLAGLPRDVPFDMVTPGEARKLVGIAGNSRKERVIAWAEVETDADFEFDQHDADAYVVARAILAHGERSTPAEDGVDA